MLASFGLLISACTGVQQNPVRRERGRRTVGGGTATGGTVRIGTAGYPDSLNPGNGLLSEAYTLYELVFDTPIAVDSSGEYVPELATEWSASEDGLTWTMTIVDDATFHDGDPLTAEDVAFSIQLYKDTEDFPFLPSYASTSRRSRRPTPTTVTLTTLEPLGNFEANMAFIYVLPKHIWEAEVADPVAVRERGDDRFRPLQARARRSRTSRRASPRTRTTGATPPNIDGVIFQKFDNADARITALTTGDIDAITEFPATAVSALQNTETSRCTSPTSQPAAACATSFSTWSPTTMPGGGRSLLRPPGAQGPRGAAGAGARHRQAADHRRGHARHGGARPLDGPARPR